MIETEKCVSLRIDDDKTCCFTASRVSRLFGKPLIFNFKQILSCISNLKCTPLHIAILDDITSVEVIGTLSVSFFIEDSKLIHTSPVCHRNSVL